MIAIDTNVLLRYLLDDDEEQSPRAARLIEDGPTGVVLVTDVVLAETLWTLQGKKYRLDRPTLANVVEALFEEPSLRFENAQAVWRALHDFRGDEGGASTGADFPDALILNVARAVAERADEPFDGLYTFDRKALRMPDTRSP